MKSFRTTGLPLSSALVILTAFALTNPAAAFDIHGARSDSYIKVTKREGFRRFELCSKSGGDASCVRLGSKSWYSVPSLRHQRAIEQWQAAGSTVGTAAITAASFLTFGAAFGLAAGVGTVSLGTTAAATGAVVVGANVSRFGPVEQFEQQYVMRPSVVNDDEIMLDTDEADIREIAARLETVLNKID